MSVLRAKHDQTGAVVIMTLYCRSTEVARGGTRKEAAGIRESSCRDCGESLVVAGIFQPVVTAGIGKVVAGNRKKSALRGARGEEVIDQEWGLFSPFREKTLLTINTNAMTKAVFYMQPHCGY